MSASFPKFAQLVGTSFQDLVQRPVFVADIESDALWEAYLAAYPEGSNPIYRTNTEHDCSCCRQFIRHVGAVVNIVNGEVRTVWDVAARKAPEFYAEVATVLRDKVRSAGVRDVFRVGSKETSFGASQTHSMDEATRQARTWNHFHTGEIPLHLRHASPGEVRGAFRTTVQVFERGLTELSPAAVETVLSLVDANNLYRGQEHRAVLAQFRDLQREFLAKTEEAKHIFAWENAGHPAARFRNSVIGTLVQDLSEGVDVERAVNSFEAKVAPQNYKRTTAVITPTMVKQAMTAIAELGLESALERRFAVIGDVSVRDVKWVDGKVKPMMKGGLEETLMRYAVTSRTACGPQDEERAESVTLDAFMSLLPEITSMEILLKGSLLGNLMSLTAPVHPEPKQLFRWSNDFAWSYGGNVADAIKERVKKAGGRVEGVALRVSLSWSNFDDLDLHIYEPTGRGLRTVQNHIYYAHRNGWTGGTLDVDMNAGRGTTREPVENIVWVNPPPDGAYRVVVNNYSHRETVNPGFTIEIENGGTLSHYTYNKTLQNQRSVEVATLYVKDGRVERVEAVDPSITSTNISQEKWGLRTEQYVPVNAVMLSPNYWGENAVGNKHTFFVLEGAQNNEETRGFYNEFLHPRLEPHRKVFEVIADKTKCQPIEGQLSGLGFSSTKKESFIVRVQRNKRQQLLNVHV